MSRVALMSRIAERDMTFSGREGHWEGKCLICGGPLRFDARTGEGATIEHIVPRSLGGTNDERNLGIAHPRCNGEKGRRWDGGHSRKRDPNRYDEIVGRLLRERERRWREPVDEDANGR